MYTDCDTFSSTFEIKLRLEMGLYLFRSSSGRHLLKNWAYMHAFKIIRKYAGAQ